VRRASTLPAVLPRTGKDSDGAGRCQQQHPLPLPLPLLLPLTVGSQHRQGRAVPPACPRCYRVQAGHQRRASLGVVCAPPKPLPAPARAGAAAAAAAGAASGAASAAASAADRDAAAAADVRQPAPTGARRASSLPAVLPRAGRPPAAHEPWRGVGPTKAPARTRSCWC
jgi:hypothetical protein